MNLQVQRVVPDQAPHYACMQRATCVPFHCARTAFSTLSGSRRSQASGRTARSGWQSSPAPVAALSSKATGGAVYGSIGGDHAGSATASALRGQAVRRQHGSRPLQLRAVQQLQTAPPAEPARKPPGYTPEDEDKEASRAFRRTVFDFERWRAHRSTSRYRRHILGIWESRIMRGLAGPLWFMAGLSTTIGIYESLREAGVLPEYFQSISVSNTAPFNLSSFALSLLLVFRTNASYARWDEARKIWGSVVNRSRDLVRQIETWVPPEEEELLSMAQRWTVAFCHSLQVHLREDGDLERELKDILPEPELKALLDSNHRPNYVLAVLSGAIDESNVTDAARVRMDENITSYSDSLGACERILKTPIPLTYTRHTSRFLVIWLTIMPFTLWHACGWGSVPASVGIAFLLLGIEEIGVQIEEPFAILPLEAICATITRDCMELHHRRFATRSLVNSIKPPGQPNGSANSRPTEEQRRVSYFRSSR